MAAVLGEAFVMIGANMTQLQSEMGRAKATSTKFVAALNKQMASYQANLRKTARIAGRSFLIIAAAMTGAVVAAAKYENQLANVSTMLSSEALPIMRKYRIEVQEMAKAFGQSTKTLTKGLYDILSASIAPEKAMAVLEAAAKAAVGGAASTATAADAITTILNAFQMDASRATEVSDKLFATVRRGKLTFEELANGIGKVAAPAAMAGLSLNEMLAAIATATRAGIKADQAMTAVAGAVMMFLKPTAEAVVLARSYEFELSAATLKAEGLSGVMKKINGLSADQVAKLFPNRRALKAVAAALQDAAGHGTDMNIMMNASGMAGEAFNKMAATMAFQWNKVKQEFMATAVAVGTQLMPVMRSILQIMTALGSALAGPVAKWLAMGAALTLVTTAVVYLVTKFKLLGLALQGVALAASTATVALTAIGGVAVVAALVLITEAISANYREVARLEKEYTNLCDTARWVFAKATGWKVAMRDEGLTVAATIERYRQYGVTIKQVIAYNKRLEKSIMDAFNSGAESVEELQAELDEVNDLFTRIGTVSIATLNRVLGKVGKTVDVNTAQFVAMGDAIERASDFVGGFAKSTADIQEEFGQLNMTDEAKALREIERKHLKDVAKVNDEYNKALTTMTKQGPIFMKDVEWLEKERDILLKRLEIIRATNIEREKDRRKKKGEGEAESTKKKDERDAKRDADDKKKDERDAKRDADAKKAAAREEFDFRMGMRRRLLNMSSKDEDKIAQMKLRHETEIRAAKEQSLNETQMFALKKMHELELASAAIDDAEEKRKKEIAGIGVTTSSAWGMLRAMQKARMKKDALNNLDPKNDKKAATRDKDRNKLLGEVKTAIEKINTNVVT